VDQGLGDVGRIDKVSKVDKKGKKYNSVYLHFKVWYDTPGAQSFQDRVLTPEKEARIVYDDPWHWIVLENKVVKQERGSVGATESLVSRDYVVKLEEERASLVQQLNDANQRLAHFEAMFQERGIESPQDVDSGPLTVGDLCADGTNKALDEAVDEAGDQAGDEA